ASAFIYDLFDLEDLLVERGVAVDLGVYFFIGVDGGRVIASHLLADERIGHAEDVAQQEHGDLPGLDHLFAAAAARQVFGVDVEKLGDGAQDLGVIHWARERLYGFFDYLLGHFFADLGLLLF